MNDKIIKKKGWLVTISGFIISISLGILYSWSIFKTEIERIIKSGSNNSFDWDLSTLNDPYSISVLVFSFTMIITGRIQDKIGPKITTVIGGIIVSAGLFLLSQFSDYIIWVSGFGIMLGIGVAFCYASITPAALKWFPDEKSGLIAGIIVSGLALSSVYIAPLSTYLISKFGIHTTMLYYSIAFLIVITIFSFFISNPPKNYILISKNPFPKINLQISNEKSPKDFLKTSNFYKIWFTYFIGAGVGLMVFSFINDMVKAGLQHLAFLGVIIIAVGNASGRIIGGALSDKIGSKKTLVIMFIFQLLMMIISTLITILNSYNPILLLLLSTSIGFAYGTNLAIFPHITKQLYGLKNFGINYGIMFVAWGLGGFLLSRISQMLYTKTDSLSSSFITAIIMLIVGLFLISKINLDKENS
ncbi:MAG: OFA family MFS transporter [Ignavibacteria bacterium]|nr:OFA family MFS transporter [Ignavibacteria bacterium]